MNRRGLLAGYLAATTSAVLGRVSRTDAATTSDFPPVAELQAQLHATPGASLPRLVVWRGQRYQPVYERAIAGAGGVYSVTIRLVRVG